MLKILLILLLLPLSSYSLPKCVGEDFTSYDKCHGMHIDDNQGLLYMTEYKNGKPHGKGIFTSKQSAVTYDGEFKNGKMHGIGNLKFPDHSRYIGEFKDGEFHGKGTLTFRGGRYEGEWKNGNYHGYGIFTLDGGVRYEGQFKTENFMVKEK